MKILTDKVELQALSAISAYDASHEAWADANAASNENPSVRDCEYFSDSMENAADLLHTALNAVLEALHAAEDAQRWMVRIITEETFKGVVTSYVGPMSREAAVEYAEDIDAHHFGEAEAYVEYLHPKED